MAHLALDTPLGRILLPYLHYRTARRAELAILEDGGYAAVKDEIGLLYDGPVDRIIAYYGKDYDKAMAITEIED